MREIRLSGSEGGGGRTQSALPPPFGGGLFGFWLVEVMCYNKLKFENLPLVSYCQKFYEKQGMRYGNRGTLDDREEREVIVE